MIHQTWKNSEVPAQWQRYQNKVKALHPDWEYRLWTDTDNDAFVKAEFPAFYPVFTAFPRNIMRVDVIRYLIMYKRGGLYLDLDYEMLKPFQYANKELVLPVSRSISFGDTRNLLGNCFFASTPNHVFWKAVIEELENSPPQANNDLEVLHATGPDFLTRMFYAGNYEDAFLPERLLFHPPTPKSRRDYERIIQNGVSQGIHHVSGTWAKKTILGRFKRAIKTIRRRNMTCPL